MSTYKIGNQVSGIIRSFCSGTLGSMTMVYDNQPYTFLKDVSVTLSFDNINRDTDVADKTLLSFNHDTLDEVRISNVKLTDKILALLYQENKDAPLYSKREVYTSDEEGKVYLNTTGTLYQVFIYNSDGDLEYAFGELTTNILTLSRSEEDYIIYYSFIGEKSYFFDKTQNIYITLDLDSVGNENDGTQDMSIHIQKGLIKVDKGMYFNRSGSNTVDLTIKVIHTNQDYITLK